MHALIAPGRPALAPPAAAPARWLRAWASAVLWLLAVALPLQGVAATSSRIHTAAHVHVAPKASPAGPTAIPAALSQAMHKLLGHAHPHAPADHPPAARPGHWASAEALQHDHRTVGHHRHAASDPSVVHLEASPHPVHDQPGGSAAKRLVGDVDTPPAGGPSAPSPGPGLTPRAPPDGPAAGPPPGRLERPPKATAPT